MQKAITLFSGFLTVLLNLTSCQAPKMPNAQIDHMILRVDNIDYHIDGLVYKTGSVERSSRPKPKGKS